MGKVTVKKLQIAQAKECVRRLDIYDKALRSVLDNLEVIKSLVFYNQWPNDFSREHKKSLDVIIGDIKSMRSEISHLALEKAELAGDLQEKREKQVQEVQNAK